MGWLVQAICLRCRQQAFCFARITASRLKGAGMRSDPILLRGEYDGPVDLPIILSPEPLVLFVGRHIPDKRPTAVPAAIKVARHSIPDLRGRIVGDGPERNSVIALISELKLEEFVDAPGFAHADELERDLKRALCLVAPSSREGYGLVVIEASARGLPTILVKGEDNAATEFIEEGVNGFITASASASDLGAAIVKVWGCGPELRRSTSDWFQRNARRLSMTESVATIIAVYSQNRGECGAGRAAKDGLWR
jgi:glycosyltransferase involved in cell wall biosynthesis